MIPGPPAPGAFLPTSGKPWSAAARVHNETRMAQPRQAVVSVRSVSCERWGAAEEAHPEHQPKPPEPEIQAAPGGTPDDDFLR